MNKLLVMLALAGMLTAGPMAAAGSVYGLEAPKGPVVLHVSGNMSVHNAGDRVELDRALIEEMPQTELVTWTPWTGDAPVRFSGVLLADLIELLGATGRRIQAVALNDYRAEIPLSDLHEHEVLLAVRRNGEYMAVRDKGPLWIVYPLDPAHRDRSAIEGRMVWQLKELVIE